jgi:hypothetical protein
MDEVLKKIAPRRREFLNYLLGTALGAPIFVARDSAWAQVAPALTPLITSSPPISPISPPAPSSKVTPLPTRPTHTPIHTPRPTHMHTPTPRPPKNIKPTPTAHRSRDHDPPPVNPSKHPKGAP